MNRQIITEQRTNTIAIYLMRQATTVRLARACGDSSRAEHALERMNEELRIYGNIARESGYTMCRETAILAEQAQHVVHSRYSVNREQLERAAYTELCTTIQTEAK